MIHATRLREPPKTLLEQIIVDSDLDVLGQERFLQRNRDLRRESAAFGLQFTDEDWYKYQLGFLQWHRYQTDSDRSLRDACKHKNLAVLSALGVSPHQAIAFEDSPVGVAAAKAAGVFCIAVPNSVTRGLDFHLADLVIPSLAGISIADLIHTAEKCHAGMI